MAPLPRTYEFLFFLIAIIVLLLFRLWYMYKPVESFSTPDLPIPVKEFESRTKKCKDLTDGIDGALEALNAYNKWSCTVLSSIKDTHAQKITEYVNNVALPAGNRQSFFGRASTLLEDQKKKFTPLVECFIDGNQRLAEETLRKHVRVLEDFMRSEQIMNANERYSKIFNVVKYAKDFVENGAMIPSTEGGFTQGDCPEAMFEYGKSQGGFCCPVEPVGYEAEKNEYTRCERSRVNTRFQCAQNPAKTGGIPVCNQKPTQGPCPASYYQYNKFEGGFCCPSYPVDYNPAQKEYKNCYKSSGWGRKSICSLDSQRSKGYRACSSVEGFAIDDTVLGRDLLDYTDKIIEQAEMFYSKTRDIKKLFEENKDIGVFLNKSFLYTEPTKGECPSGMFQFGASGDLCCPSRPAGFDKKANAFTTCPTPRVEDSELCALNKANRQGKPMCYVRGILYGIADGVLYRGILDIDSVAWSKVLPSFAFLTVSINDNGVVYATLMNRVIISWADSPTPTYTIIPGALFIANINGPSQLAVGTNYDNLVFYQDISKPSSWNIIPGRLLYVATNGSRLAGFNNVGQFFTSGSIDKGDWTNHPLPFVPALAVSMYADTTVLMSTESSLYVSTSMPPRFVNVGSNYKHACINKTYVVAVKNDGDLFYSKNPINSVWYKLNTPAKFNWITAVMDYP